MLQPKRTTCLVCKKPLEVRQRIYCSKQCANEIYKRQLTDRYRSDGGYRQRQLIKVRSYKRLPKGFMPPPCVQCGTDEVKRERHHDDYRREDDVIWLCRSCHKRLHARLKREAA